MSLVSLLSAAVAACRFASVSVHVHVAPSSPIVLRERRAEAGDCGWWAVEQMHRAVVPSSPASYPDAETKNLVPKLQMEACNEAQALHKRLVQMQQQKEALSAKLAEAEVRFLLLRDMQARAV